MVANDAGPGAGASEQTSKEEIPVEAEEGAEDPKRRRCRPGQDEGDEKEDPVPHGERAKPFGLHIFHIDLVIPSRFVDRYLAKDGDRQPLLLSR